MNLLRLILTASLAGGFSYSALCRGGEISDLSIAREWTDSTGRFHTLATFLGGDESQVRLRKQTGSTITVTMSRLSAADQHFVRSRSKNAERLERQAPSTSSPANTEALRLDRTELFRNAVAWLDEVKGSSPTERKRPPISSVVGPSAESPLVSANAARLPENMIYIRVSTAFLRRWAEKETSQSAPVSDNILGTPIVGNSTTVSRTQFELQPNRQAAVGVLRLFGTTNSSTVGDAGPVQVFCSGVTQFQSAKTIWLDSQGIHQSPAVTNAQTHSTITGLQTSLPRLRGRIALRIGGNRAADSHAVAEAVTAQHVAQRVSRQFDGSANEEIGTFWATFTARMNSLAANNPMRPREWQASSTKEMVQLVALGAPGDGSGYVSAPTTDLAPADVRVDIHVAVIKSALGDATLKKAIGPTVAMLATAQRPDPADGSTINWSADRNWLSIAWGSTGSRQEPLDRTAATFKTAR